MGKKTVFTNITPLPRQVSREVAVAMLHNHDEMIELNPLVIEHHPIKTPRDAPKDEFLDCAWQEMTDRINYMPGGIMKGKVSYKGCFHDLPNGLQTHIYAPMGLHIREKWTICGTLPGEPEEPRELGINVPSRGLYLREDGEMKCNMLMTSFVRKNLDNSHKVLVERILAKAERVQAHLDSDMSRSTTMQSSSTPTSSASAFQRGSHMSNSAIIQSMNQNRDIAGPETGHYGAQSASPAVASARSTLRQEFVSELAGSSAEAGQKPLPRQPSEDEDDAEMATIHPALREQYRRSRSGGLGQQDTVLPAYDTITHQRGQYYHEDMAKRSGGKQFVAELEGCRPETIYGESRTSETPADEDVRSFHVRSQSHPVMASDETSSPNESGNRTIDRYSIVSGLSEMPTPKVNEQGWQSAVDNRYSTVSAMTDVPTPRVQQQGFAQAHEQRDNFF